LILQPVMLEWGNEHPWVSQCVPILFIRLKRRYGLSLPVLQQLVSTSSCNPCWNVLCARRNKPRRRRDFPWHRRRRSYWRSVEEWSLCFAYREVKNLILSYYTHTRLTALCPGLPRWAGTRQVKPICVLLEQEIVSGSGISWAICKSAPRSRQITTPAPHYSVFYRPDALPAAQPTTSKHWRNLILSY